MKVFLKKYSTYLGCINIIQGCTSLKQKKKKVNILQNETKNYFIENISHIIEMCKI